MSNPHRPSAFVDILIDEVRQRRHSLFAACGNDLDALVTRIRELEAEHPERMGDPRDTSADRDSRVS
jgi:hypothetical protein